MPAACAKVYDIAVNRQGEPVPHDSDMAWHLVAALGSPTRVNTRHRRRPNGWPSRGRYADYCTIFSGAVVDTVCGSPTGSDVHNHSCLPALPRGDVGGLVARPDFSVHMHQKWRSVVRN